MHRDCDAASANDVSDGDSDGDSDTSLESVAALAAQLNALTAPGGALHNFTGAVESLAPTARSPAWVQAATCDCDACSSGLAVACYNEGDAWCATAAATPD